MLGSYRCECMEGFEIFNTSIVSQECVDIDECSEDSSYSNICHQYAKCENTYGSFNCSCLEGFQGDGKHCQDIDECQLAQKLNSSLCSFNGVCQNTIGFYTCECMKGFQLMNNSIDCTGIFCVSLFVVDIQVC